MYTASKDETQNAICIVKVLEDHAGGGTVKRSGLKGTDSLKPGTVVCKNASNLFEAYKSAKAQAAASGTPTAYPVGKNHEFVVGDVIMIAGKSGAAAVSEPITSIDTTNADKDIINVATTIGAFVATDYLVLSAAEVASAAVESQTPYGIILNEVDLSVPNQQSGIMVRGTVNESILPYAYPTKVKTTLNLIRFI
jgi:hypothetical protein